MRHNFEVVKAIKPVAEGEVKASNGKKKTKYDALLKAMRKLKTDDYVIFVKDAEPLNVQNKVYAISSALGRRISTVERANYTIAYHLSKEIDGKYEIIIKRK